MLCAPGMHHGIVLFVAGVAMIEALFEYDIYALTQGVKMRDRRSGRSVVLGVVLRELTEVEVVSTIFDLGSPLQGCVRGNEDGQSGRKSESLLHSGKENIDSEFVEIDGHCGERRNGVDDEKDILERIDDLSDLLQRVQDAG